MSTNSYILNLLNIKDENIHILSNKIESKVIKGKNYMIIWKAIRILKKIET